MSFQKQVLTERLDALLLEKAETEQQCLCLKKENMRMKQELEVRYLRWLFSVCLSLFLFFVNLN